MYQYDINAGLAPVKGSPGEDGNLLYLCTSEELTQGLLPPGLEGVLHHLGSGEGARICRAESRHDCLSGTIVTPRRTREGRPISFGYLMTKDRVVLCDDTGTVHTMLRHLQQEEPQRMKGLGGFFYDLLELLIDKDLHHLQALEDQMAQMEDRVLSGEMVAFNPQMTALRKEIIGWIRYYTQLDDVLCEFQENENGYFTPEELRLFRLVEKRVGRLNNEAQTLREYCLQLREMFQAEIDIRQNRIMKILTIVTTIFLPLSLVAGWYGMNFAYMPELRWEYGYPAVIITSVLIVAFSLWLMKKKKFW